MTAFDELPVDSDLATREPAGPAHDRPAGRTKTRTGHRARPDVLAAIAVGGALGAPARYGVAQLIHGGPHSFPWATFWTNTTGSFALGVIVIMVVERFPPSRHLHPFVATGFLGAYTTYSSFAVETDLLIKRGRVGIALAYAATSLIAGCVAVWVGTLAARLIPPGRRGGNP